MSNSIPSQNLDDLIVKLQKNLDTNSGEVNLLINMTRHSIEYLNVVNVNQDLGVAVLGVGGQVLFHSSKSHFHFYLDLLINAAKFLSNNVLLVVSNLDDIAVAHSYFEMAEVNYGIIIDDANFKIRWQKWTYLSNSSFIVASNKLALKTFADSYIFPIIWWEDFVLNTELFAKYQPKIVENRTQKPIKRVLLISYFGLNLNTVGVLRPNYWFKHIPSLSNYQLHIEVATATKPTVIESNVHFIPDFGIDSSLSYNQSEFWLHNQLSDQVNTLGLSWNKELVTYFETADLHYDAVILTGNPFMNFYFSIYAKHKWNALVIQDYRDPLAKNPRMAPEFEMIRAQLEDRFCSMADQVVTVNQVCSELMSDRVAQPIVVIPNGFDETWLTINKDQSLVVADGLNARSSGLENQLFRQIKMAKSRSKFLGKWVSRADWLINQQHFLPKTISKNDRVVRLVYAGSFSQDRNPRNLIQAVKDVLGFELHHFGAKYKLHHGTNSRIISHGKVNQFQMNDILNGFEIGVVYCGHNFESTTKVYDYIAKNLHILIITPQNNPKPKTLATELAGLQGIHWVVDNVQAIRQFLQTFINYPISRPQRKFFSRKAGTEQLIDLLKSAKKMQNTQSYDLPLIANTQFSYQDLIQKQGIALMRQRFERRYPIIEQSYAGVQFQPSDSSAGALQASVFNNQRLRFLTAELAMMQYQMQQQALLDLPKLKTIPKKNKNVLVLCTDYPHQDSLYGGAFIVPRVQAYIESGFKVSIFVLKERQPASNQIIELDTSIAIHRGNQKALKKLLPKVAPTCIVAHSLSLSGYQVLKQMSLLDRLIVIYHGFEIRDVGHLWYNFSEENLAKNFRRIFEQDLIRKKLAIEIFQNSTISKVFVSNFLKNLCEEDLGIKPINHQVIPNYIDEQLFDYVPKQDADRLKIFSIRPYDNHNYAADLIIACIMELSKKSFFSELSFHIQGFGHTFKEKTRLIAHFNNVTVVEGILDQRQISQLHKNHGIALIPTRFDTQGVSLGEAMASGLVPVTNACAAITEFIPNDCAVLAPTNDVMAMAQGIEEMYYLPEVFHKKSKQAASHIREIAGKKSTIEQELKLLSIRSSHGLLNVIKKFYT